jgi:hypothetical protein
MDAGDLGPSATFNAEITRSLASDPVFTAARAKTGPLIRPAPVNSVSVLPCLDLGKSSSHTARQT